MDGQYQGMGFLTCWKRKSLPECPKIPLHHLREEALESGFIYGKPSAAGMWMEAGFGPRRSCKVYMHWVTHLYPWEANPGGRDKGPPSWATSHWSVETWEWRSIQDGKSTVTLGSAQGCTDQNKTGTFKQADDCSVNMWFLNKYQNTRQETVWFWKYPSKAFCMFSGVTPSSVKKAEKSGLILGAGGNPAHIWACSLGSHE